VSDASELERLDARKGLQEDRDGARETQIERFRSSAPWWSEPAGPYSTSITWY